jgi:hypothetical protein
VLLIINTVLEDSVKAPLVAINDGVPAAYRSASVPELVLIPPLMIAVEVLLLST